MTSTNQDRKLTDAKLAETIAMWRDRAAYPTVQAIADALGINRTNVFRRVHEALRRKVECYRRNDTSVAAAKWFAGAGKVAK